MHPVGVGVGLWGGAGGGQVAGGEGRLSPFSCSRLC